MLRKFFRKKVDDDSSSSNADSNGDGWGTDESDQDNPSPPRRRGGIDIGRCHSLQPWSQAPSASALGENTPPREEGLTQGDDVVRTSAAGTVSQIRAPLSDCVNYVVLHQKPGCVVFKAVDRTTGSFVAIRAHETSHMSPSERRHVEQEATILQMLRSCPGVVPLRSMREDGSSIYMRFNFLQGGSLTDFLVGVGGRLPSEDAALDVVLPLLLALRRVHELGIVHRNVTPNNVLLTGDGQLQLNDFKLAAHLSEHPNDHVGDLEYAAPEVIAAPTLAEVFQEVLNRGADETDIPAYGTSADVWSVGVLSFEALAARRPFLGHSREAMMECVSQQLHDLADTGLPRFLEAESCLDDTARNFLSQCLTFRPSERPSVEQLLLHPWFAGASPGRQRCTINARRVSTRVSFESASPRMSTRSSVESRASKSLGGRGKGGRSSRNESLDHASRLDGSAAHARR